jgi:hypothetical protein
MSRGNSWGETVALQGRFAPVEEGETAQRVKGLGRSALR